MFQSTARLIPRRLLLGAVALVIVIALIWREAHDWRQFDWHTFWRYSASISALPVLIAIACIYVAYAIRAVRWRVLADFRGQHPFELLRPTLIGFAAMALLGRVGEFARPLLISRRARATVESQMVVWFVERLFDLGAAILLIGVALLLTSDALPYVATFRVIGILGLAGAVVAAVTLAWSVKYASQAGQGGFIRTRLQRAALGATALRSASSVAAAAALSVVMWMVIAAAYFAALHSYRVPAAHLSLPQVLVLMGFGIAGSLIPLPAAGGQQLAVAAALVAVFHLPSDLAVSCAILLWLATWMSVIPAGLILLRKEGLTLRAIAAQRTASGDSL